MTFRNKLKQAFQPNLIRNTYMQPTLASGEWLPIYMRKEFDRQECYFYAGYQKKEKKKPEWEL